MATLIAAMAPMGHGIPDQTRQGVEKWDSYVLTSQEDVALLFTFNFVFTDGKYSGSSLSLQGYNPLEANYRELAVIGGSAVFRLAKGSAVASTYWANATTQDGIVDFTVYVLHYDEGDNNEQYAQDM
ncbi:OLC1v1024527C1 [Oldenlandia corymbosa var. corymbosa]|uniref:Dirigent protein n=1 Tax=Oldenlandia corymbosa var. corymbosa TaxID=529605 RepID=A0AAV1C5K9_OLDCO|nr:OLC1v1024527C1 [Oldenlandia corymbosa var. corymbosa]